MAPSSTGEPPSARQSDTSKYLWRRAARFDSLSFLRGGGGDGETARFLRCGRAVAGPVGGWRSAGAASRRGGLTLAPAYHYIQSNLLLRRAVPYLVQLSSSTEEATNISVLEGTHVVFVVRFVSRHGLQVNASVGTRMPAFCTGSGIAILSHLPRQEAEAILRASRLNPYTPYTTWRMPDLLAKLELAAERGYAVCVDEMTINDISVAAPVLDTDGRPIAAVNVGVSKLRIDAAAAEAQFAPLVVATAQAISG